MTRIGATAAVATLVVGLQTASAADYPISGAWTFAPTSSEGIISVRSACRAFRYREQVAQAGAAARLVVFDAKRSTWYDKQHVRSCRILSVSRTGARLFAVRESCVATPGSGREQRSYRLKQLNSLQVLISIDGEQRRRPGQLIGCP
jgi:hypothetical protein